MSAGSRLTGLLLAGALCLPVAAQADTPAAHRVHKTKKQQPLPPPLPSGAQGPVPQIPLDAIPAVAPTISYQDGMLTIVAPNSTLGDILRGVRKHTAADIEIPATANERVVTRLGPAPAREVVAELLNGSHFNYICWDPRRTPISWYGWCWSQKLDPITHRLQPRPPMPLLLRRERSTPAQMLPIPRQRMRPQTNPLPIRARRMESSRGPCLPTSRE